MAANTSDGLTYFLLIEQSRKDDLAAIRQWSNLKIAFENEQIWVKDFDYAQIHSQEVKCIPYKIIYDCHLGKLHLAGSLLPERTVPNLLWTAIDRGLPVRLPSFNHNYFGIREKLSMRLIPSENEHPVVSMLVSLRDLQSCLETTSAVRLQRLNWVLLNNDKAFIQGTPLLPIPGDVYWQNGSFMIPVGYDFELPLLTKTLNQLIDTENEHWVIWDTDTRYALINRDDMKPLTLSSFRASVLHHPLQF